MRRNYKYDYDDELELDEELQENKNETRLTFRLIKGKPNRDPSHFAMVIEDECKEVQYKGRTCVRVLCGSPAEFKAFKEFCHQYLGDFPAESPYVYIPKNVLVQQPKEKRRKKSLFKD